MSKKKSELELIFPECPDCHGKNYTSKTENEDGSVTFKVCSTCSLTSNDFDTFLNRIRKAGWAIATEIQARKARKT